MTVLIVLLSLTLPLFFTNLDSNSIWDANEAFYVETPREMLERGDLVVPYFNFEPRLNKPPLSYWMVAGLYTLFGTSVAVQRLGIAIGGLLIVGCAFCLGWAISGERRPGTTAYLAALGLAADPRLVMFSRRIFIDVWLAAFMGVTLVGFVFAQHRPARRRLFLILMYVSAGLGLLTKGPVALILPALVFALYLALRRELHRVRDMMLPAGVAIVTAIAAPWYVALYLREGWGPIASFFIGENIGRYTSGIGYEQSRGMLFYLPVLFTDSFPLSLFLIPAAFLHVARDKSARSTLHVARDEATLLWIWIAVIVAFFSFSHDKQDLYILPVLPAIAALGADAIYRWQDSPRAVSAAAVVLGVIFFGSGLSVLYIFTSGGSVYALAGAATVGAIAAAGGAITILSGFQKRIWIAVATALFTLVIVNWLLVVRLLSGMEQYKPVPVLTTWLKPRISSEDRLSTLNIALPSMVHYLQHRVNVHYAEDPFVADVLGPQQTFAILPESDYSRLRPLLLHTCVRLRVPAFEMKLKQIVGGTPPPNLLLVTNRCSPN